MVKGVRFAGVASGLKQSGLDLGLVLFDEPASLAALYTKNRVKAAHILYNRRTGGPVRALLVNAGVANACTGAAGVADLRKIAEAVSKELGIAPGEVRFASTGVIGKRLPVGKMVAALPELARSLGEGNIDVFARAIMTTDTYPKIVEEQARSGKDFSIAGVAKGAGMINPRMATMLSFIFADCHIGQERLNGFLPLLSKESFEKISVDGDTSTNDSVMVFVRAAGAAAADAAAFEEKLGRVMRKLSSLLVHDGEGLTRVIHIVVKGARREGAAEKIARTIASSPLVKTAFFGCDPNWGRIICAVGYAGVPLTPEKIDIAVQGEWLAKGGAEVPFSEEEMKRRMNAKDVELVVDLHDGTDEFDFYTTDLTYDYVKINASYRT